MCSRLWTHFTSSSRQYLPCDFHVMTQVNRHPLHSMVSTARMAPRIFLCTMISFGPRSAILSSWDGRVRHEPEQAACGPVQLARELAYDRIVNALPRDVPVRRISRLRTAFLVPSDVRVSDAATASSSDRRSPYA